LKRYGLVGSLLLLILVIAGIVLLTLPDSGNDNSAAEVEQTSKPGFVWANGEWLKVPFFVETDASVLRINTRLIRRVTKPVEVGAPPAPAVTDTLGSLLESAITRFDELGGPTSNAPPEKTLNDLMQYVESQPGAAAVKFEAPALSITADNGDAGYVILQRPDPVTQYQAVQALQALTTRWKTDLQNGDVLLFSGDVTVEVPASQALGFLRELVTIYDLPSTDQQQRMADLTGSQELARALIEAGRPPKSILDRIPPPPLEGHSQLNTSLVSFSSPATGAGTASLLLQGDLHTPASNKAYFFEPTDAEAPNWCATDAAIAAAKLQGYQIIDLRGNASTIAATIASSGQAGIFYFCGQWHGLEPAKNLADALAKTAEYRQELGLTGEDLYPIVSLTGVNADGKAVPEYYVGAASGFYVKEWQSSNSIVFQSACSDADLAQGFNAREFIAIEGQCFATEAQQKVDADFFGRLAGTVGDGNSRSVGAAFSAAFNGTGWVLRGTGEGQTVLSPAVEDYSPKTSVSVSPTTPLTGQVKFDTPVDQTTSGVIENLLHADGCGAVVTGQRWVDPYTFEFDFTTAEAGSLSLTVNAAWAASADAPALKLDGNQDPPDTDHVGPNHDDFVWTVECTAS
jgi:hypothetical protein